MPGSKNSVVLSGAYDESEKLYRESLAMKRRVFGDKHPEVAMGLNNLEQLEDAPEYDPNVVLTEERVREYMRSGSKAG